MCARHPLAVVVVVNIHIRCGCIYVLYVVVVGGVVVSTYGLHQHNTCEGSVVIDIDDAN